MGKRKGAKLGGRAAKRMKKTQGFSEDEEEDPQEVAKIQREVRKDYKAMREAQAIAEAEEEMLPPEMPGPAELEAAAEAKAEEEAKADAQGGEGDEKPDPYLMADAVYIQKETRWRNKQRTLIFGSRGINAQSRHLVEDFKKLLPHHKAEPKFEKRDNLHEINEICELKSCNNVLYFEARKHTDLYMWMARVPSGPSIKFQVLNIHTTGEVKLAGNCLMGSRPILYFDKNFSDISFLRLMKEMIQQVWGTPRNHPKSKPFHDHVMSFYWLDKKIWFRHYQISPEGPDDFNDPERQTLTEIGPRFVLDPICILQGAFCGQKIYANPFYMSPTALRVHARSLLRSPYVQKLKVKKNRQDRIEANKLPADPLDSVFE
mmetsp:Transcript_1253/g.3547  ORF Transcript_1253/g.3547 Transcript_1253/m.3547 type:complete len:374 (-) Transcript_1253:76-1197(-)